MLTVIYLIHLWTQSVARSLSLSSWLCAFLRLPSIFVLGYRVTGAVLVCGVPQSPRGPQLHVMVSISLVHSWKESVCMCVRLCVFGCVLCRVEVHIGQALAVIS